MNVGIILSCSVVVEAYFRWFDLKIITVQKYCSANETHCCAREREGKEKLTLMVQNVQIGKKLTRMVHVVQIRVVTLMVQCVHIGEKLTLIVQGVQIVRVDTNDVQIGE